MNEFKGIIRSVYRATFAVTFFVLSSVVCFSAAPLFNIAPIASECEGLSASEASEYKSLYAVVESLSASRTLDEFKDLLLASKGRQFVSSSEFQALQRNDPEKIARYVGNFATEQEYVEFLKRTQGLFPIGRLGFFTLVVKRLSSCSELISIVCDTGYIEFEVSRNPESGIGIIRELHLIKYEDNIATYYQFYPNGILKRRFMLKFAMAKETYVISSRPYDKAPESDVNPLIDWQLRVIREFYAPPTEIYGDVVSWSETGKYLGVEKEATIDTILNDVKVLSNVPDNSDESIVSDVKESNASALFNFKPLAPLPTDGIDEHDRNYIQAISEAFRVLNDSRTINELFANINSARIHCESANGKERDFDAFAWNFSSDNSNEITFESSKMTIWLHTSRSYLRSVEELDEPYIIDGVLKDGLVKEYGRDTSHIFCFNSNGSLVTLLYGKHSRIHQGAIVACLPYKSFDRIMNSIESKELSDKIGVEYTSAYTVFPEYKVGKELRWNDDGTLTFSKEYDTPQPFWSK